MYLIKAESKNDYDAKKHVCENFSRDLKYNVGHAWNHIVLDGKEYNLEPQVGRIFVGRDDGTGASLDYDACKAKSINKRARLFKDFLNDKIKDDGFIDGAYYNGNDRSKYFVLNPLLVLKGRHPELFADRAVFKEFITHNPEVRVWQSAWYSYRYGNDHASDRKIDAMIKGTKVEVNTVTPNESMAAVKKDFIDDDDSEDEDDDDEDDDEPGDYFDPEESILTHVDKEGNETCYASDGVNKWYLEGRIWYYISSSDSHRYAYIATDYSDIYFPKHIKEELKILSTDYPYHTQSGYMFSIDPVITIPAHKKSR